MDVCFYKATVPVFINICVSPVLSIVPTVVLGGGGVEVSLVVETGDEEKSIYKLVIWHLVVACRPEGC